MNTLRFLSDVKIHTCISIQGLGELKCFYFLLRVREDFLWHQKDYQVVYNHAVALIQNWKQSKDTQTLLGHPKSPSGQEYHVIRFNKRVILKDCICILFFCHSHSLKEGHCTLFFCHSHSHSHSHSHNDNGNVYLLFPSKASG